jgi:hypothetical protein
MSADENVVVANSKNKQRLASERFLEWIVAMTALEKQNFRKICTFGTENRNQ